MPKLSPTNIEENEIRWILSTSTYPMDAIYGACYVFVDRCYVYLDAPAPRRVEVVLRGKEPLDRAEMEALVGDFANGLLHQVIRIRLAKRTGAVRDMIVGRALLSAQPDADPLTEDAYGAPGAELDPIPEDELGDYLDDPLGIAVPWEEKYGEEDSAKPRPDGADKGDGDA